jgi:hypothetical protein
MLATSLVDEAQELPRVGDLVCVSRAHPLKDAEDLNVLSTLEHRGGDEQAEESTPITCTERAAIDREGSDPPRIAEHLDDTWIGSAAEVVIEVPVNDGLRCRDLVRARSTRV